MILQESRNLQSNITEVILLSGAVTRQARNQLSPKGGSFFHQHFILIAFFIIGAYILTRMHVGPNSSLTHMHAQTHGHEHTHRKWTHNVQRRHNNNVNRYEETYDITTATLILT